LFKEKNLIGMEKDDFVKDDLIGRLIQKNPLEEPSQGFVDAVMEKILQAPETIPAKRPFFHWIKSAVPYLIICLFLVLIFLTSDLAFFQSFPGSDYWYDTLLPYMQNIFAAMKGALSSKYVSMALLIGISVVFLFLVERVMSRKGSLRRHTMV